jgi:uncharacterized protein (TIGR02266 family)
MRIKLKYPDVETFIQKYAVNISRGGIFIATKQPKPVGTFVKFEFLLSNAEAESIIRGEGQVQWTKEFDPANPARAHGMGVKFMRLDAGSQAVVDRALRWRAEHGTSPNAQVPSSTSSSAHATVMTASQARKLDDLADSTENTTQRRSADPQDLATSEDTTTARRQARDDLAASEDAPTSVREPSQAGRLPSSAAAADEPTDVRAPPRPDDVRPPTLDENTRAAAAAQLRAALAAGLGGALDGGATTHDAAQSAGASPAESPAGRRDETRPIAIHHDDEEPRPRHSQTRPIAVGGAGARRGDEIDALASEWGLSEEKLARSLKRARPRIVEATAELERLLLKPPKPPAPSKAEAMAQLAALLAKRGPRDGGKEPQGSNGNGARDDEKREEPAGGDDDERERLQRAR